MTSFLPIAAGSLAAQNFPLQILDNVEWLTNSAFVCIIVMVVVLFLARRATKKIKLVPDGPQNAFEAIIEVLYDTLEEIVGPKMVSKVFSMLATLFLFILTANWFGLLPGVGSIGWQVDASAGGLNSLVSPGTMQSLAQVNVPLFRPTTADLNMTLAMAAIFMVFWFYWSLREMGPVGFLKHMFGVKGGLKGFMAFSLAPIFFMVGIIEVVSIAFRPVSLSLRLFGNVFAGETLLATMLTIGKTLGAPPVVAYLMSIIVPIPFYFLELLVGVLQAMVFTLLCAVYITLSTSHDEEDDHGNHDETRQAA